MLLNCSSQMCDSRFNCSWGIFFFFPTDPKLFKAPATVLDFAFDSSRGFSYSVTHSKLNWEEAHQNCNNNASELASILDPYSQALLFLLAKEYGEPLWIGLNSNMVRKNTLHTSSQADTGPDLYALVLLPIGISASVVLKTACYINVTAICTGNLQIRLIQ